MKNDLAREPRQPTVVIASSRYRNRPLTKQVAGSIGANVHWVASPEQLTSGCWRLLKPRYVFFSHWSNPIPANVYEAFECVILHMAGLPFGGGGRPLQNLIARQIYETNVSATHCTAGVDAGPVYGKRPLSLHRKAEKVFLRACDIIGEKIIDVIRTEPAPVEQVGESIVFRRRKPESGSIGGLETLVQFFGWIRMLEAQGYPPAFFNAGRFRFEFSRASRTHEALIADVRTTVRDAERESMRRVLVVVAHADDAVLGMGDTMVRHSMKGYEASVFSMGDEVSSRGTTCTEVAARAAATDAASQAVLGNAGFPDNALDSMPLLDVVKEIERVSTDLAPDLVFAHFHGDVNVDHGLIDRAVLTAFRPLPSTPVTEARAFEVLSSTEWAVADQDHPDTYVDVSCVVQQLLEAYDCCAQVQTVDPHVRSRDAPLHKVRSRGRSGGLDAAEAFATLHRVTCSDTSPRRTRRGHGATTPVGSLFGPLDLKQERKQCRMA